jgi:hypothetical protein
VGVDVGGISVAVGGRTVWVGEGSTVSVFAQAVSQTTPMAIAMGR